MPPPMPSTEYTVAGAVVDLLLADAALYGLVGNSVFSGDLPPEYPLPFIWVSARDASTRWVTTANRFETTELRIEVYATGAAAAGLPNPAEAIAGGVERVLNTGGVAGWQDLPIPNTTPIRFEQKQHTLSEDAKRARDKSRVYKVVMTWTVELYVHS